jgi:glucose-1-phosphate adenylyltransferase
VRQTLALVLSGGGGERLSVLSVERAVAALPFGGKYRVIDFTLSNCCHSGVGRVGVVTQHAPTSLHDHIGAGRPWDLDRRGGGVFILQPYLTRSHAGRYRGTADAIEQNWDVIEDHMPPRVLVLSGDHVYRMDYRGLLLTHQQERAAVTIAVTRVPPEQSRRFGMATVSKDGRISALDEKPERAETPFASMGIYLFETDVLGEMLAHKPVDLVLDVIRPLLMQGRRVVAHEFKGYWEDVGTVSTFYRSNRELLAPEPRLVLHDTRWPILTRDEERAPVLMREGAVVDNSLVANGARVAGTVRNSVISPGVVVKAGAEVVDSILMSDVTVEPGARVERAIIDKYATVGEGAHLGVKPSCDDPALDWLDGLVLVGKDADIPAGTRVHAPAVIGIGSRAADFQAGTLPGGTLLGNRAWYEEGV